MSKGAYWCPNGCGKSVLFTYLPSDTLKRGYVCQRCKTAFSKSAVKKEK